MNARVRVLIGLAVLNMLVGAALAQPPVPDPDPIPEYLTKQVGKAWEVKYDRAQDPPNKKDRAIRVIITADPETGAETLNLIRYTHVDESGFYQSRPYGGNVSLPIKSPEPNSHSSKRKIFITDKVEYVGVGGVKREVQVKGWWHPGPGRNRDDHRLNIRILDKKKGGEVGPAARAPVAPTAKVPTAMVPTALVPCDEEPDTDVLAEIIMVVNPDVLNTYFPPTYP